MFDFWFFHLLSKPFVSYVGLSFCWFCFSLLSCLLLLVVVVGYIKLLCFGFCFFLSLGFLGLVMCYVLVFFGLLLFFVFGGFKGQVRWPKGPPHLALSPPYLFCFVVGLFFGFLCWLFFLLLLLLLFFYWKG